MKFMKKTNLAVGTFALAAVALAGCGGGGSGSGSTPAGNILGLTSTNQLVRFNSTSPATVSNPIPITGLQAGETLVGIDLRPSDGLVYGIGSASRVYRINANTGAATQIGAAGAFTLNGADFGVDFNPVPDRIRIVSNADQNLRVNPNDGTLTTADTTLAYAGGDVNAGANPNQVAVAYTNSDNPAPATTTLYGIDTNLDILTIQNPPNNGTLNTVGPLTLAGTPLNVTGKVAFDIAGTASATSGVAFAGLNVGGTQGLYTINLGTGATTLIGNIGTLDPVISLTVIQ